MTASDSISPGWTGSFEPSPRLPSRGARRWRRRDWVFLFVLLAVGFAWFLAFPAQSPLDPTDIAFDLAVLAMSSTGLYWVCSQRRRLFEGAWKLLVASHFLCLLDCFTSEPPVARTLISAGTFLSEGGAILAILWGFHRYQRWRDRQSRRLHRSRLQRVESDRRYAELVNSVEGIVWEADPKTWKFLFVSKQAERIVGYPTRQWCEEDGFWANHIHPEDRERAVAFCLEECKHRRSHELEYRMIAADGSVVWMRDLVKSVRGPDGIWRLRGVMFVITQTKELEERLRHGATHDSLTGLPNRESLLETLRQVHARNSEAPSYALLFLDVDQFKIINDTLGHHHGDTVLVELARRLSGFAGGRGTVARLGGDEFAVLLEQVRNGVAAVKAAERLKGVISEPLVVQGRRIEPSASIGIVLGRADCADVQDLLQDADTAMYRAKSSQRGSAQLFDLEMRRDLFNRVQLEADLKRGFRAGEFRVFFQPIVDLPSGRTEGFEALTRWQHPERGIVEAGEFMQVALEGEMGADLAWNAVEQTFRQAALWERRFLGAFRLSSNVSETQFVQPDFLARMETLLAVSGADPRNLVLEITEDIAAEDLVTEQKLCELKRMGFELALDDFGVGRSSLNRLCRLPIDLIKIDRTFIQSLEHGESEVLIRAISAVAEDLGMEVVAEGIETEEQCSRLLELGFRLGQGFLFDRAMPGDEAERRLADRPSHLVSQWTGAVL